MKKKRVNKIEKPVFHRMFLKKLLAWLMVAIVIGFAGSNLAIQVLGEYMENEQIYYSREMYHQVESIAKEYYEYEKQGEWKKNAGEGVTSSKKELALSDDELNEAEKEEQFKLWIEYEAYVNSLHDTAYMLLDADTWEVVAQSSYNKIYWLARIDADDSEKRIEGNYTIYACEDEEVVEKLREEYTEVDYGKESMLYVWVEDMYVDGFTCVPGKVRLVGLNSTGRFDYNNVVKELDFTPDDITGYTHIVTDEMVEKDELIGPYWYHNNMSKMTEWMEKEEIADPVFREELESESGYGVHYTVKGNQKQIDYVNLSVGEGDAEKVFWLVTYSQNSFWEMYQTEVILIYVGLVSVAFVVALISSYTAYIKQKSSYEMDQYRRNMTNTMAHDLKSPLMVISGFAENLLEQDLAEKPKHFTSSILDNVQYMNQIIDKVLELSKVESAEYKLQKEDVDLRKISEKLVENYTSQMDERGLEIRLSGECVVSADELCMMQVLDNLIGNAVKYSIEGSVIEIQLSDNKYKIANTSSVDFDVEVKDLTTPFVKGDNSRSGKKGSGIGLAIVKNLVEQHGYHLEIECNDRIFVAEIVW
ncbi:MAG: HAMP domain-containing histidine kinase [Lachnospiraceae bacterium]|nr:HAMP domain-containing histidine kinase [Lachnospiraceae bacterium]